MTISIRDFKNIEELVRRRKYLVEFAECLDASNKVQIIIQGKEHGTLGLYDDARMFLLDRISDVKAICAADCRKQIAEIETKLAAFGISLDA